MGFGNSPSSTSTSNTNTSTSNTTNAPGIGGDASGAVVTGNSGSVVTSDFGALSIAKDIALSGLTSSQQSLTAATATEADALKRNTDLAKQVNSGGLTTVLTPLIYVAGAIAAAYFFFKGKK